MRIAAVVRATLLAPYSRLPMSVSCAPVLAIIKHAAVLGRLSSLCICWPKQLVERALTVATCVYCTLIVDALQAEAALSAVAAVRKRTEPRWLAGKPY
jgi:hypothetical protein